MAALGRDQVESEMAAPERDWAEMVAQEQDQAELEMAASGRGQAQEG